MLYDPKLIDTNTKDRQRLRKKTSKHHFCTNWQLARLNHNVILKDFLY